MTPKHSHVGSSNYLNIINSSNTDSHRRPSKTPLKTPLRLSSMKKKTPSTLFTNDRYIPNRNSSQIELGYHLLVSNKDQENMVKTEGSVDTIKRRLIDEIGIGPKCNEKSKVLCLHSKQPESSMDNGMYSESFKMLYTGATSSVKKKNAIRHVKATPERVLDAPDFIDDFCESFSFNLSNKFSVKRRIELFRFF